MHTLLSHTNLVDKLNTGRRNPFFQYFVLFTILLCSLMGYGLSHIYGFSMYPDEFGYWASAANAVGYDWTDVAALGSYYSYGYSLILTPILWVFGGGVIAYRVAIVVNMLLQCISLFLIKGIMVRLYPKMRVSDLIYCCGFAVFYPVWSFYVQMTLTEALLSFLFVLIAYLITRFVEHPHVCWAIGLVITAVYTFSVHMRAIGVAGAVLLILLIWVWQRPKLRKWIFIALPILAIIAIGVLFLKGYIQSAVYGGASREILNENDFGGQINTFLRLFTAEGLLGLGLGIICKLYYLGLASFGTFYISVWYLFKQTKLLFKRMKQGKDIQTKQYVAFFLLVSVVVQFMITAAYVNVVTKLDNIAYGRYNEFVLPILIAIGIRNLMRMKGAKIWFYALGTSLASVVGCVVTIIYSLRFSDLKMHEYFVAGISYSWNDSSFDIVRDYTKATALGIGILLIVTMCIFYSRKRRALTQLLNVVIVMEIILTLVLGNMITYNSAVMDRQDSWVADYIKGQNDNAKVWYVSEVQGRSYIDLIQFNLGKRHIDVIDSQQLDATETGDYLITDSDSSLNGSIDDSYGLVHDTPWFRLYVKD